MKILLDTNVYVGFMRGHHGIVDYLAQATSIIFSPIVLGELLFGFRCGTRYDKNIQELNSFLAHAVVAKAPLTDVTSDRYSRIAARLKKLGTPIPTNDLWIAAQTMETGAELVTMDTHFKNIHGLVYCFFPQVDE
ncbi:MAG: type II toxin-antitoxin system VapC family toxin [Desulfovermiculus sp.]